MQKLLENITSVIPDIFKYCDVGARSGIEDPWSLFQDFLEISSFEPDREEYESLLAQKSGIDKIYPLALSRESGNISLNLTKSRGCSSLFKPNSKFLKNFPDAERFEIEETVKVEATTINDLSNDKTLSSIDFIKIDVQGAELDILKGGDKFLSENILGMQLEVEFQPIYLNQPLFPEVDTYVKNTFGLQIQDLKKSYWKYSEGINIGSSKGQLVFGDALYFRPPHEILAWCANFNKDAAARKLHMACLMGIIYGYLDYSLCILNQPNLNTFIDDATVEKWKVIIQHYGHSHRYKGKGAGRMTTIFNLLFRMNLLDHQGWASSGHHLGSRKNFGIFN
jgi:FkbM family methyltransferase